jgi:hypothetical protein
MNGRAKSAKRIQHDAENFFAENSPAIYGWVSRQSIIQSPAGTKEACGSANISVVPDGTRDVANLRTQP